MSTVSPTIRRLRQRKNLTAADIERLTHGAVKRGALSMIERGKVPNPSFPRVNTLAKALEITPQACHAAIAASVVAGARPDARLARGRPPRVPPRPAGTLPPGRPKAGAQTLETALERARQVVAALEEQLAARST